MRIGHVCRILLHLRGRLCSYGRFKILSLFLLSACCLVTIRLKRSTSHGLPRSDAAKNYTLSTSRNDPVYTVLFWNRFYDAFGYGVGFGARPFQRCEFQNCVATKNKRNIHNADAVIFHIRNYWLPIRRRRVHQRYVFFSGESPTYSPDLSYLGGYFNVTMTYRHDSDVINPYYEVLEGAMNGELQPSSGRRVPVAWIVSHCRTGSLRELYVKKLQDYIDIGIYGACGHRSCPKQGVECHKILAKSHYFYLSLENSQCQDYITEKFSNALKYGMVPVVMGPDRATYERRAPPNSFIHVDDFEGPQELAEHLRYLISNSTAYAQYFEWRKRYSISSSQGWCNLCRYLNEQHDHKSYENIKEWWFSSCAQGTSSDISTIVMWVCFVVLLMSIFGCVYHLLASDA